jgi:hypothetical protein
VALFLILRIHRRHCHRLKEETVRHLIRSYVPNYAYTLLLDKILIRLITPSLLCTRSVQDSLQKREILRLEIVTVLRENGPNRNIPVQNKFLIGVYHTFVPDSHE